MDKILVIRYGTIGDSIFASAFYRELRKALPNAQIDSLVDGISGEVMKNCPYINNLHYIKGKYNNFINYIKLFRNYDTVYFLKNDKFFTKVAFFAGVKNRIGFDQNRNIKLTQKAPYNCYHHEIECYLHLLKITGIPVTSNKTEVWITKSNNDKPDKILRNIPQKKVLIQAYSRFCEKNWIDEYWVSVIKELSKNKIQVFFAGGTKDIMQYQNLLNEVNIDSDFAPINTCGYLSVNESFALISKMDLVVGIDSGLMHAASALEIPSILLHGPTSISRWKPDSDKCTVLSENFLCSPCSLQPNTINYCKHKTPECMLSLTPQKVVATIYEKLSLKSEEKVLS